MRQIIYSLIIVFLFSCTNEQECSDYPQDIVSYSLKSTRLEKEFFTLISGAEIITFMNKYPGFSDSFLERKKYSDSVLVDNLKPLIENVEI